MSQNLPFHVDVPDMTPDDLPRVAGVRISPTLMTHLLLLPPGVRVCRIRMDGDELECVLTGPQFEGVPIGQLLPQISLTYEQRQAEPEDLIAEPIGLGS